ncbi:MAG: ABC transporter permease [Bdellovibrionales bacterium]|nr:ABC transporter permease [Bdellovibrionales bacterium]
MSYVRKVALRYLRTKRSEAFISILTFISTVALAIGVAVLVVVMSIMNGFEYELKNKLLGANAHVTVRAISGPLFGWERAKEITQSVGGVASVSPFTYHQGLFQVERKSNGVLVRGIREKDAAGEEVRGNLVDGEGRTRGLFVSSSEDPDSPLPGIVVGKELADSFLLNEGDIITILSPQVQSSPFGLMPRFRRFQISGIYSTGLVEYENSLVYVDLGVAQNFFRMNDSVQGLEVRLQNVDAAPEIADQIAEQLRQELTGLYTQPWTETHKNLWEALRLERSAYFTVLLLLIVMASFSIVSTLVMLVLEKRKDIAVLRTLGATQREVGAIFRMTGMTIGVVGTISGLLLGLVLNLALETYGFPLPEKIFPVSTLPIRMDGTAFALTGVCALAICFLATIYPVRRASHLRPSELLRYE